MVAAKALMQASQLDPHAAAQRGVEVRQRFIK
jgi:hypothetical protein